MLDSRYENDGQSILNLNELQRAMKIQIDAKITNSVYCFENVPCAVCNGNNFEPIADKDRYGLHVPVKICTSCGLIQTNPRMTQASYNQFYAAEYRNLYVGTKECTVTFFENQLSRAANIYTFIRNSIPTIDDKPHFILEIGCGAGGILKYFEERGHRVMGLDLGEQYLEYGRRNHGLDLSFGTIHDYNRSEKPNLIIYSHVLEHILDVNKELQKAREIISPDGLIYIEVPSIKNLLVPYNGNFLLFLQNAHVYHFSLITLQNLLTKNGFQMVAGNEYVQSLFIKKEILDLRPINDHDAALRHLIKAEWLVKLKISHLMGFFLPLITKVMNRLNLSRGLRSLYSKFITK